MKNKVLAGTTLVLLAAAVVGGQEQPKTDVPYDCSGLTITFTRCGNVGCQDMCFYQAQVAGQPQIAEGKKLRSEILGLLKSCKVGTPRPAGAVTPGQPLNPPYLSEMPSVEKVLQAMKTNDPREAALRQMGAFYELSEIIKTLSGNREFRGFFPDEKRFLDEYSVAQYKIGQAIDAAFPGPYLQEKQVSFNTPYHYSRNDPRFGFEGIAVWPTFFPKGLQEQFAKIVGADNARYAAKIAEERRTSQAALAANSAAARGETPASQSQPTRNDPGTLAARRCVESGRSEMECVGEGLKTGLNDLFGGGVVGQALGAGLPGASGGPVGLRLSGDFSAASFSLLFTDSSAVLTCGTLVPQNLSYSVEKSGDQYAVKIDSSPKAIVASFRPDGKLAGPGPVLVAGRVVVGTQAGGGGGTAYEAQTHTTTQQTQIPAADVANHPIGEVHQNGMEYSTSQQVTSTTYEPVVHSPQPAVAITAPKTEKCNIRVMQGRAAVGIGATLNSMLDPASGKPAGKPFGVRVIGTYGGQSGLNIEFRSDLATVECGPAHVAMPYDVENGGGQVHVKIRNPAGAFVLTMKPDGTMQGSGTVNVAGRVITGSSADNLTYAPKNASCPIGVLSLQGRN